MKCVLPLLLPLVFLCLFAAPAFATVPEDLQAVSVTIKAGMLKARATL